MNRFHGKVADILFAEAVRAGDGFRQWFYPNKPENYAPRDDLEKVIRCQEGVMIYPTAEDIANAIYRKYR